MNDEDAMRLALEAADHAAAHQDVPVGCVIVAPDGRLLARGENRREVDGDPTAHAELVAVRRAAEALGQWRLDGCTLVVTLEPCAMCAGAAVNARVRRIVFGATDPKAGAVTSRFGVGVDDQLNHRFDWTAGVLADDCVQRLQEFFRRLRADGQR
jgi:tRNA(adenine34) deaminase